MRKLVHVIDLIRPGGGPHGYLYNLRRFGGRYKGLNNFEILFERESDDRSSGEQKKKYSDFIYRWAKPVLFSAALLGLKKFSGERELRANPDNVYCAHLVTIAARLMRIRSRNTKICVMPHGPVSFSDETMDALDATHGTSILSSVFRRILNWLEEKVFEKSDGIVVASKFGLEAYFSDRGVNHSVVLEVLSGVPEFSDVTDPDKIRAELGVPEGSRVLGFFGRYIEGKGFDKYLNLVQCCLGEENLFFLSAGVGPIKSIESDNFKDLGWRKDIGRILSACDAIIVANKNTYFDLLPLEALSCGVPVIASCVGGNKTLGMRSSAVFLYDGSESDLLSVTQRFASFDEADIVKLKELAKSDYSTQFDMYHFVENHRNLAALAVSTFHD